MIVSRRVIRLQAQRHARPRIRLRAHASEERRIGHRTRVLARTAAQRQPAAVGRRAGCRPQGRHDRTPDIPSALERLVVQVQPPKATERPIAPPSAPSPEDSPAAPPVAPLVAPRVVPLSTGLAAGLVTAVSAPIVTTVAAPEIPDTGRATSTAPKRLALVREFVASVVAGRDVADPRDDADLQLAALVLGWLHRGEDASLAVSDAGTLLLDTQPGSADEATAFATAMLEHAPLCRITGALLLGEWLELRDLGPALARELALHPAQAARLMPCVLAWRDELRGRGWAPRQIALHLKTRTAWMTGLSTRARDVLARLGVVTPDRLRAADPADLRDAPGCRPDILREIERLREQLEIPAAPRGSRRRVAEVRDDAPVLLRRITAFDLSARARNVLHELGAVCIGDVIALEPKTLLQRPHCGRKTFEEIAALVSGLGLHLGTPQADAPASGSAAATEAPRPAVATSTRAAVESAIERDDEDDDEGDDDDADDAGTDDAEPVSVDAVRGVARRLIEQRGCVSIGALSRACAEAPGLESDVDALRHALEDDASVRWIDDARAWFSIAGVANPLLARVEAVLAESGRLEPTALRDAVARDPRIGRHVPPASVLAALRERLGGPATAAARPRVVAEPVIAAAPESRRGAKAATKRAAVEPRVAVEPSAPVDPIALAKASIDGDSLVEDLARAAGLTIEELVTLALGEGATLGLFGAPADGPVARRPSKRQRAGR